MLLDTCHVCRDAVATHACTHDRPMLRAARMRWRQAVARLAHSLAGSIAMQQPTHALNPLKLAR